MLRRLDTSKIPHQLRSTFRDEGAFLAKLLGVSDSVIRLVRSTKSRIFVCMCHPVKLAGIHDCSADCCSVSIHILCGRVCYDIGTPLDRPAVHRCRECVIHDERNPMRMCGFGEFFNIKNRQCRICDRFAEYGTCVILKCCI